MGARSRAEALGAENVSMTQLPQNGASRVFSKREGRPPQIGARRVPAGRTPRRLA